MSQVFEIPLSPAPQKFSITLLGIQYIMSTAWCQGADCWSLSIADLNDVPILSSIPLVTGANLLEQYDYLGLGFQLQVQTDGDIDAVPTFENLGITGHLYAVFP